MSNPNTNLVLEAKLKELVAKNAPTIPFGQDKVPTGSNGSSLPELPAYAQPLVDQAQIADVSRQTQDLFPESFKPENLPTEKEFYTPNHQEDLFQKEFILIDEKIAGLKKGVDIFNEIAKLDKELQLDFEVMKVVGDLLLSLEPGMKVRMTQVPEYSIGLDQPTGKKVIILELSLPSYSESDLEKVLNDKSVKLTPKRETRIQFNLSRDTLKDKTGNYLIVNSIFDVRPDTKVEQEPLFKTEGKVLSYAYKPTSKGIGKLVALPFDSEDFIEISDLSTGDTLKSQLVKGWAEKVKDKQSNEELEAQQFFTTVNRLNPLVWAAGIGLSLAVNPLFLLAPVIKELGFYVASRFPNTKIGKGMRSAIRQHVSTLMYDEAYAAQASGYDRNYVSFNHLRPNKKWYRNLQTFLWDFFDEIYMAFHPELREDKQKNKENISISS